MTSARIEIANQQVFLRTARLVRGLRYGKVTGEQFDIIIGRIQALAAAAKEARYA